MLKNDVSSHSEENNYVSLSSCLPSYDKIERMTCDCTEESQHSFIKKMGMTSVHSLTCLHYMTCTFYERTKIHGS